VAVAVAVIVVVVVVVVVIVVVIERERTETGHGGAIAPVTLPPRPPPTFRNVCPARGTSQMVDYREQVRRRIERWQEAIALTQALGSLAEASRRSGLPRKEIDNARWELETGGMAALQRMAERCVRRSPQFVAVVEDAITRLFRTNPDWGRGRLARRLTERGFPVSASTVRRVLVRRGLVPRVECVRHGV